MTLSKLFARPYWGLAALLIAVLPAPILAEPVVLGGVGSLTPVVKVLGEEYAKKYPGFEFSVIEPPWAPKQACAQASNSALSTCANFSA